MVVRLINPSHVSFGIGVITPRWLYVLAAATPRRFGDPILVDETLEPLDFATIKRGRRRRHRHSYRQRLARLRSRPGRARSRRHRHLWRHSRHAVSGRGARARRRARGRQGGRRRRVGRVIDDCLAGTPAADLRRRADRGGTSSCRRAGICCRPTATCGRRCRPSAGVRSTARSARCGGPTGRNRASDRPTRSIEEIVDLRRRGFRFIALADDNFYPVTLTDLQMASPATRIRTSSRR